MKIDIFYRVFGGFFLIFHFHPTTGEDNIYKIVSYFALLAVFGIDSVMGIIKHFKDIQKKG